MRQPTNPNLKEEETQAFSESLYNALRRAVFLAAGLFLIYRLAVPISAILLLFLMVFIVAAAFNPLATWFQARRIPRLASALGFVLTLVGGTAALTWLAVPPLLTQSTSFFQQLGQQQPHLQQSYERLLQRYPELSSLLPSSEQLLERLAPNLSVLLGHVGGYAVNLVSGLFSVVVLLVLLVYTIALPEPLVVGFLSATPAAYRNRAETTLLRCMEQLKHWAWGSLILGATIGIMTGIGLSLFGVPYAFLFGALAAIGELLPTIGPILASIPPLILTLMTSPWLTLWVLVFFLIIHQLESQVLAPIIFGGRMNLHPVSIVFTLLVMHALFGLVGAILAVPVCAIIKVCWEELYLKPSGTDQPRLQQEAGEIVSGVNRLADSEEPNPEATQE